MLSDCSDEVNIKRVSCYKAILNFEVISHRLSDIVVSVKLQFACDNFLI